MLTKIIGEIILKERSQFG